MSVVFYNMKCIFCFNLLFHRAGKPPPGLHLDCTKDGKMIQVIKYLQVFETYDSTMNMHLDSGVAMWHTHAVLFHECNINKMEYQHNLYLRSFSVLLKHLTYPQTWNLHIMCIIPEFSNLVIIYNIFVS